MSDVQTSDLADLARSMPGDIDHLVVSASYEERAYGIWENIHNGIKGQKFICFNANHESYLRKNLNRFSAIDPGAKTVELDSDEPHTTFEAI